MSRALWTWAIVFTVLIGSACAFGPPQNDSTSVPPISPEAAQKFAIDLHAFIWQVQAQYVREVSEVDLLVAAISSLHEAVGQPAPTDVRDQLVTLKKNPATFPGESVMLLTRLRTKIGDRPELRDRRDVIAAVEGLTKVLDPYCGFTHAQEFSREENGRLSTGVQFQNVARPMAMQGAEPPFGLARGATQGPVPATLLVKSVVPGSPAQKEGLRPGDVITRIDNRPCSELSWAQIYGVFFPDSVESSAHDPMRGHNLAFRRPGSDQPRLAIIYAVEYLDAETVFGVNRDGNGVWNHVISRSDRLCYARIGPISLTTHIAVQALLARMEADGNQGLLLDLRWCPGGYMTPAQAVARSFLDHDEPIARIRYRRSDSNTESEEQVPRYPHLPVVVLINGETSGGGELIAAALQDYGRAKIAGERSLGKATVQHALNPNPLSISYRISVGEFLTPKSKRLDRFVSGMGSDEWGVRPDAGRWLPMTPATSKQLKEWWTWHSLRPAGSREALPTDDPDVDAQLTAALQMLRQMTSKAKS